MTPVNAHKANIHTMQIKWKNIHTSEIYELACISYLVVVHVISSRCH
jgi:hypothetical protein